jgi:hypothetical protein
MLSPETRGNATVRSFLGGVQSSLTGGDSTSTLVAKASILFHRAAHLTGQWTPSNSFLFLTTHSFAKHSPVDMQQREFQAFAAAFQTVNRLIETFRSHLPPITKHEANDPAVRTLILIHGLTDAASIKLHGIFAYADSASKQHCLTAARNVIQCGGVNLTDVGYLNPIMGVSQHHKHVAMRR